MLTLWEASLERLAAGQASFHEPVDDVHPPATDGPSGSPVREIREGHPGGRGAVGAAPSPGGASARSGKPSR